MHYRNVFRVVGSLCLVASTQVGAQFPTTTGAKAGTAQFPTTTGAKAENGSQFKNDASVAIATCRSTAGIMVLRAHPHADSVRFSLGPQIQPVSQYATDVRDVGAYQDNVTREWALFAIDCTYNYQTGEARVSITWAPGTGDELKTAKTERERESKAERNSKKATRVAESPGTKTP